MPTVETKTVIQTPPPTEDSPAVLAYRVGQLEIAVTGGIGELKDEIKNLTSTFAPQAYVLELKLERDRQILAMQKQIDTNKRETNIRFDRLWGRTVALATLVIAIATLAVYIISVVKK